MGTGRALPTRVTPTPERPRGEHVFLLPAGFLLYFQSRRDQNYLTNFLRRPLAYATMRASLGTIIRYSQSRETKTKE